MAYLRTEMCQQLAEEQLESLQVANIWTANDLCQADLVELKRSTGIKYIVLKDLHDRVSQHYTLNCYNLEFLVDKSVVECKMVPTGLPELTRALDGGFQTQEIVEFFGDSECGKTEMCYLLCGEILSHYDDYNILFVASSFDIEHEKLIKYIRSKAGNRELGDDDIFNCLKRLQIARPVKLADLVHLLNTLTHNDKRNTTKCIIIDSLSFIIQDDILDIKSSNLNDTEDVEKFAGLKRKSFIEKSGTIENAKKELTDNYLHDVMRLLTSIAINKNVIIVLTNSDTQLTFHNSWTNAIDHRIQLTRMHEFSQYCIQNPKATVCKATILKTIHNLSKVGNSIPFVINDEGLFAIRLNQVTKIS